jgi:hypothetical protein
MSLVTRRLPRQFTRKTLGETLFPSLLLMPKKKKTFVQRFASQLRVIHERAVTVRGDVRDFDQATQLCEETAQSSQIYLVPKNDDNQALFADSPTRICILIYDGTMGIVSNNADARFALKPETQTCTLCTEYMPHESRSCNYCNVSFCITCQIKLLIDGVKNATYQFKCPFCGKTEALSADITTASIELIGRSFLARINQERTKRNVTSAEATHLERYLAEAVRYRRRSDAAKDDEAEQDDIQTESVSRP